MAQFDPERPTREEYDSDHNELLRQIRELRAQLAKAQGGSANPSASAPGITLYAPPASAGSGGSGSSAPAGVTVRGIDSSGAARVVSGVTDITVHNGVITILSASSIEIDVIGVSDS